MIRVGMCGSGAMTGSVTIMTGIRAIPGDRMSARAEYDEEGVGGHPRVSAGRVPAISTTRG